MDLSALVGLALRASICLIVFSLGLGSTHQDALYLFRHPGQLVRSLFAMNVIMPLVAAALAAPFGLNPAQQLTLIALSVSPVPPILPKKELSAGGRASYAVSLLVTAALLAIVLVPLSLRLLAPLFSVEAHMPMHIVARLVAITVVIPVGAGIVVRWLAPGLAARLAPKISLGALVLLALAVVMILWSAWPAAWLMVGDGRVLALAVFVVIGLVVGHLLGGPSPEDRTVLALSAAQRHPGMALAIAGALFPQHQKLVTGGIVLYLLVGTILSVPYLIWRRRQPAPVPGAART